MAIRGWEGDATAPERRAVGRGVLAVLIPAHNEEAAIGDTLDALTEQTSVPSRVIVVTDNCSDRTAAVASEHGAEVIPTVDNTHRKAGALNQALRALADSAPEYVLVVDADTRLSPRFVETALAEADDKPRLGAVSGLFVGDSPSGLLQQFQANEYERYRAQVLTTGRVAVVTGTASLFRFEALQDVAAHRGTDLPGLPGDVYDRGAITEDSELTLALKSRGWRLTAPKACVCFTELMPTWGDLHRQRVRWYKGMLDNLRAYRVTPVTLRYLGQQLMIGIGVLTIATLLVLTLLSLTAGTFALQPFWLALGGVFLIERLVTVWQIGPRGRAVAAAFLPEIGYDMALQTAFVHAVTLAILHRDTSWNHVTSTPATSSTPAQSRPASASHLEGVVHVSVADHVSRRPGHDGRSAGPELGGRLDPLRGGPGVPHHRAGAAQARGARTGGDRGRRLPPVGLPDGRAPRRPVTAAGGD